MPMNGINSGSVAVEQERAVAEAQGQMTLAKRFPRDINAAHAEVMQACQLRTLADVAFYAIPQGGKSVSGPSIRLAEEIARCYGNFEFGHRELSRCDSTPTAPGKSEIEIYAWDKEKNNRSIRQISVSHTIDTKDGPRRIRDQRDIDNKIANVASKQIRGRILALLPKWLVEEAIETCKKTLAGQTEEPLDVRIRRMTQAFARFGITTDHLERHLGHGLDETLIDELVDLQGLFNALRDGSLKPSELFGDKNPVSGTVTRGAQETEKVIHQTIEDGIKEENKEGTSTISTRKEVPGAQKGVEGKDSPQHPIENKRKIDTNEKNDLDFKGNSLKTDDGLTLPSGNNKNELF